MDLRRPGRIGTPMSSSTFFETPQGAAVLKHGILKRYLPVFANKTGSYAGEVVYLDCFAGPGAYTDQSYGSPALALEVAKAIAGYRGRATLRGHLIENDRSNAVALRQLLEDQGADWEVYDGRADTHVPTILASLDPAAPVFAFIDPFGLPIPFDQVASILARMRSPAGRVATEVLMNFSTSGIRRAGGQLTGGGTDPTMLKARATILDRMDDAMGGDWWHEIWRSGDDHRVDRIRDRYKENLRKAAGGNWGYFDINVSDRWQGPPAYHLLLFTSHEDGIWAFHQALSKAQEEYRTYCYANEGILDLEPLTQREAEWIAHIESNVERRVGEGPFETVYNMTDVFGDAFGQARETHLRKALKNLRKAGKISTEPKGDLGRLTIRP